MTDATEDRELELLMAPLLERGAAAFDAEHGADRADSDKLHAGAMSVVTQEDYLAQPLLCLQHAIVIGPLHILLRGSGALLASLARRKRKR